MNFFDLSIRNMDMYHAVASFFIYSILGWIVESIYMSFCNKKLTNRGFIKGPICPIYGCGAMMVYFMLAPFEGNYVAIYFVGTFIATTFEFLVAMIMQQVFNQVWWDYHNKPFNYKGMICLESSIVWGFYCVITFAFLQDAIMYVIDWGTARIGLQTGHMILTLLIFYYFVSFFKTLVAQKSFSIKEPVTQVQRVWRELLKR